MAESPGDPLGILYSFRRCPYAIRARLALEATGVKIDTIQPVAIKTSPVQTKANTLELREVNLAAKPPELLAVSSKGTVPVLVMADGTVLDESQAIVRWCLERSGGTWPSDGPAQQWISRCDGEFKKLLDHCRYPQRHPNGDAGDARQQALNLLRQWNQELIDQPDLAERPELSWMIGPFLRQFRNLDAERFDLEPGLERLRLWLDALLDSAAFHAVMAPPWAERQAWHSPSWLYHLCLGEQWRQAKQEGVYPWSTRGMTFASVGFVHASWQHQVAATYHRFYADAEDVLLLVLDPVAISKAGVSLRQEPAPESGELFPHLYGPLPMEAVLMAEPYPGNRDRQD